MLIPTAARDYPESCHAGRGCPPVEGAAICLSVSIRRAVRTSLFSQAQAMNITAALDGLTSVMTCILLGTVEAATRRSKLAELVTHAVEGDSA